MRLFKKIIMSMKKINKNVVFLFIEKMCKNDTFKS